MLTPQKVLNSTIMEKGDLNRIHIFMANGGEQLSGLVPQSQATELSSAFKSQTDKVLELTVYAIDGTDALILVKVACIASMIVEVPDVQQELRDIANKITEASRANVGAGILTPPAGMRVKR